MRSALALVVALSASAAAAQEVTYSKDVAPILFENCVYCHRPGEIAPFSMTAFKLQSSTRQEWFRLS